MMKKARNSDGSKTFKPSEILSEQQIKAYFSRKHRMDQHKEIIDEHDSEATIDDFLEFQQKECLNEAMEEVLNQIREPTKQIFLPESYPTTSRVRSRRHHKRRHHKRHHKRQAHNLGHKLLEKILKMITDI